MTDEQRSALIWLNTHGGEGVIDNYGRVVAQGEVYGSAMSAALWLRLFTTGHIESAGPMRLRLTDYGREEAPAPPRTRPQAAIPHKPLMVDDNEDEFA